MPILVTGAAGQVGSELVRRGGASVIALDRNSLDITDEQSIRAAIQKYSPDAVINAAAYTAVDRAETDVDSTYAINAEGPLFLAKACADADIPLFHLSTDYVFNGEGVTPYRETDPAAPLGVYALSKFKGEEAIRQSGARHIILRVSWVVGARGNNFVKTMLRLGAERDSLRIVSDQHGAPTCADDIADVLLELATRSVHGENLAYGTYHYCGQPMTTWFSFAEKIFLHAVNLGLLTKTPVLTPIATEEYPTPAKRPKNSRMDCSLFESTFGLTTKSWEDGLIRILAELKAEADRPHK